MKVGDGTPGPGRPKGGHNKFTNDIKAMIVAALNGAGGQEYLQEQADKNPAAFLTLVGKVLPMQLQGDPNAPLLGKLEVVLVKPPG